MQPDLSRKKVTVPALPDLSRRISQFATARDWDQFHSPKNLAIALSVEAAELLEHFQWLTEEQARNLPADRLEAVAAEMADVFIYLIRLAEKLDVDLLAAADRKLCVNEEKYPVDKARGNATKSTEFHR